MLSLFFAINNLIFLVIFAFQADLNLMAPSFHDHDLKQKPYLGCVPLLHNHPELALPLFLPIGLSFLIFLLGLPLAASYVK